MKSYVTESMFIDGFSSRKENFSYDGLMALYDYLIEYEDSCDTEIEFDPIALCCEYNEYKNLEEIKESYNNIKSIEDLRDRTQVIEFNGGIIIQNF